MILACSLALYSLQAAFGKLLICLSLFGRTPQQLYSCGARRYQQEGGVFWPAEACVKEAATPHRL